MKPGVSATEMLLPPVQLRRRSVALNPHRVRVPLPDAARHPDEHSAGSPSPARACQFVLPLTSALQVPSSEHADRPDADLDTHRVHRTIVALWPVNGDPLA